MTDRRRNRRGGRVKGSLNTRVTKSNDQPQPGDAWGGRGRDGKLLPPGELPPLDDDDVPTLEGWAASHCGTSGLGLAQEQQPDVTGICPGKSGRDFLERLTAAMRRNGIPLWSPREWSNGEATDRAGGGRPDAD